MNPDKLRNLLFHTGYPKWRYEQTEKAVYSGSFSNFSQIKVLPLEIRNILDSKLTILSFKPLNVLKSQKGDAHKAALKLKDKRIIETALLSRDLKHWSVCLSTQAGCAVCCPFCNSGKEGLKRNLSWEEIADQALFWKSYLKNNNLGNIQSIVYMGMGEPFLNYQNTAISIRIINEKLGIGKRHISISTCGHIPGIRRFAKDFPQINLAISLHSARNEQRNKLVPINARYPLKQLSKAVKDYIEITKRKVFIEYIMIDGVNDRSCDAGKLSEWIKNTHENKYFTVNLIAYNETGKLYKASPIEKIQNFQKLLAIKGIKTTIRKSLGYEIKGACGQLALEK